MKKLFLLFAMVTLLIGVQSCKQKPAEDTEAAVEVTEEAVVDDTTDITVPAAVTDTKGVKNTSEGGG